MVEIARYHNECNMEGGIMIRGGVRTSGSSRQLDMADGDR